jgi:hypothetical protein
LDVVIVISLDFREGGNGSIIIKGNNIVLESESALLEFRHFKFSDNSISKSAISAEINDIVQYAEVVNVDVRTGNAEISSVQILVGIQETSIVRVAGV